MAPDITVGTGLFVGIAILFGIFIGFIFSKLSNSILKQDKQDKQSVQMISVPSASDLTASLTNSNTSLNSSMESVDPPIFTIVLTGGPCGGKSTALSQLSSFLKPLGYEVFTVPEAATILFTSGAKYWSGMSQHQLVTFQSSIIDLMITLEDQFREIARTTGKPSIIICDRGTMDSAAYTDPVSWQLMLEEHGWTNEGLRDNRYDAVIHLVTAADGAEKFFENSVIRKETPEQAKKIDAALQKSWMGHSKFQIIDNSTSFAEKMQRCVSFISKIIGTPIPASTQRKWELAILPEIPGDVFKYTLEQTYLVSSKDMESRLERKTIGNYSTYIISHKRWSPDRDTFAIHERIITPREYMTLRTQADSNRKLVKKFIQKFFWNQLPFSIVEYLEPVSNVKYVQVETDKEIGFPAWLHVTEEVTGNPDYSSYYISKIKN